MEKSKKHCTGASPESPSMVKHIKCSIWNSPGDLRGSPGISGDLRRSPAIAPEVEQELLVGGPLPTRHGQDDGSYTNSLKLINCLIILGNFIHSEEL